jgi:hypothetical protein
MRTTIALATFLVVGAGAVGVSALDLKGSDTLEGITKALLLDAALDCGGTGNTPAGGLVYVGTGSSNGESAIISNIQAVAPMSRFLNPAIPGTTGQVCSLPNTAAAGSPSQQTSEGIVFALDGLSIVASEGTGGADICNGSGAAACAPALPNGLAYGGGNVLTVPGYVCPTATDTAPFAPADPTCVNGSYKLLDSKDVLRLVYFGLDHDFKAAAQRNCGNPSAASGYLSNPGLVRSVLVETWGNLFRDPASCTGCTRLWRAFRRNDESGTTDAFISLLSRPAICAAVGTGCTAVGLNVSVAVPSIDQATRRSLFCNSRQAAGVQCGAGEQGGFDNFTNANNLPHKIGATAVDSDPPPPMTAPGGPAAAGPTVPNPVIGGWDFPDASFGTIGADPYFTDFQDFDCIRRQCAGPFGDVVKEQACSARGDLGLVIPIWDPPAPTTTVDPFPATACQFGKFVAVAAPPCNGSTPSICPNGEKPQSAVCPINPGLCLAPALASGDPRCRNNALNRFSGQRLVDGRVYNLHLHANDLAPNPDHPYATASRQNPAAPGTLIQAKMVGAYYRIHQNNFLDVAQANHLVIRGTGNNFSATESTPAGATAACNPTTVGTVSATRLIGCYAGSADRCAVGFAGGEAATMPGADALRANGIAPDPICVRDNSYPLSRKLYFNTVKGFENVAGDELKLARCFASRTIVDPKVIAEGFVTRTTNTADGTICQDFDEQALCGGPAAPSACANNIAPIPQ